MRRTSEFDLWMAGWLSLLGLVAVGCSGGDSLLVGLQSRDAVVVAQTKDKILALDAGERVRLCREGMQLTENETAVWCALRLGWTMIDDKEAPRYLELLWSAMGGAEGKEAFWNFRSLVGSSELPGYLQRLGELPSKPGFRSNILGQLHRQLREEHIPLLCEIMSGEDLELANTAYVGLTLVLKLADGPREFVARTLLQRPTDEGRKSTENRSGLTPVRALPPLDTRPGYPPLLRACISHYLPLDYKDFKRASMVKNWLVRWIRDEDPGAADKDLLLGLLVSKNTDGPLTALHGLRKLGDSSCISTIRAMLGDLDGDELVAAHATLASLGSNRSLDWLIQDAKTNPLSIVLLLGLAPAQGQELARAWMQKADLETAARLIRLPGSSRHLHYGLELDPERDLAWLAPLLLAKRVSLPIALLALEAQPWFRTKDMLFAQSQVENWAVALARDEKWDHDASFMLFCALLETSSRKMLIRFLQDLSKTDWRYRVYDILLQVGAPEMEDFLLEVHEEEDVEYGTLGLANTQTPRMQSLLRKVATDPDEEPDRLAALRAVSIAQGIPSKVQWLTEDQNLTTEQFVRIRDLVLGDQAIPAFVLWMNWMRRTAIQEEDYWFDDSFASVQDSRVTEFLLSARAEREQGLYPEITRALALHGYAPAVREVEAIYRTGRYRWIDEATNPAYLPGGDLAMIPFWITELETNCCRQPEVNGMFQNVFEARFNECQGEDRKTPAFHARQWWKQAEGRLHYSRILDRYVIGVREEK